MKMALTLATVLSHILKYMLSIYLLIPKRFVLYVVRELVAYNFGGDRISV